MVRGLGKGSVTFVLRLEWVGVGLVWVGFRFGFELGLRLGFDSSSCSGPCLSLGLRYGSGPLPGPPELPPS